MSDAERFLNDILSTNLQSPDDLDRPIVTLTFAQSLDAKIAGIGGKQLRLSGDESMLMTHHMRAMHSAILVGIGTALNDNPQLNVRLLPLRDPPYVPPQPIILDSTLRLSSACKLLSQGVGRYPWVLYRAAEDAALSARHDALVSAGARLIPINVNSQENGLPLLEVLRTLKKNGMTSLMVEGGATVIRSFLAQPKLVDTIIVTVAPLLVGVDGVACDASETSETLASFKHVGTTLMGRDSVVALKHYR